MGQSLTKKEAAELVDRSTRWVERNAADLRHEQDGFDLAKLPPEAQEKWARKQNVIQMTTPAAAPGQLALALTLPQGPNLSDSDRAEAEKRYTVIEPLIKPEKYALLYIQHRHSKVAVVNYLAAQHNTKPRTVYHWLKLYRNEGLPGLVCRDRADKGKPRSLNNAALEFILAAAMPKKGAYGELTVAEIYRAYFEERAWRASHVGKPLGEFELLKYRRYLDGSGRLSADAQLPDASYSTFRTWFGRIPEVAKVFGREGQEAFSNTQEIISFRNLTEIKPLDYVVMDHRRLDIFCLVRSKTGWNLARPWLTAAIDMRTRKWLAWVIVENPSSDSIAATLKRAFLAYGLPKSLYWDNGKDFTCEWFEGKSVRSRKAAKIGELGTAWRGVLDTLNVRVHHAIVRRARSKIIEPNFLNVAGIDKTMPWYCGHKPTARPERFGALIDQHERWMKGADVEPAFPTIQEVAGLYDEALNTLNEREHTGEGMVKITPTGRGWLCPNEAWELHIGKVERRPVPADVLQFAFAKRREITVRNGEVRTTFGARQYHYRLADSNVSLMAFNGREVQIAYDPLDLETAALYCDNRFLGLAHCIELRRMGEDAFVEDEKARRASRREVRKFIEAVHQQVPVSDYRERALRRRAVLPEQVQPVGDGGGSPTPGALNIPLPPPIAEAIVAASAAAEFSFAKAPVAGADLIRQADASAYRDDDDEFRFFKGD